MRLHPLHRFISVLPSDLLHRVQYAPLRSCIALTISNSLLHLTLLDITLSWPSCINFSSMQLLFLRMALADFMCNEIQCTFSIVHWMLFKKRHFSTFHLHPKRFVFPKSLNQIQAHLNQSRTDGKCSACVTLLTLIINYSKQHIT